ncbi:hypothetical protein ACQP1U_09760 [Actinomycetota bacterium]
MTTLEIIVLVVALLLAAAWFLSYTAARLDRLHGKVEGALSALDASLVRRAEATLELANAGLLDPARSLILADAAAASLEHTNAREGEDLLDGQSFAGREPVESDLTHALGLALTPEVVAMLGREAGDGPLQRVADAGIRVQMARRFHNDAVTDAVRVRRKPVVRAFRLAGHARMPATVEFDDELPAALRR